MKYQAYRKLKINDECLYINQINIFIILQQLQILHKLFQKLFCIFRYHLILNHQKIYIFMNIILNSREIQN